MAEEKIMQRCFMCGSEYQFGPHRYDGKYISRYQISVCRSCYDSNWDGWAHYEPRLVAHLKANNLPIPARNEKGWLPRE